MRESPFPCSLQNAVLSLVLVLLVLLHVVPDRELLSVEMIAYLSADDLALTLLLMQWHLALLLSMSGPCSTAALFELGLDLCE